MTRRGTTVLELLVAGVLLGALTTVCVEMLAVAAAQRRASEEKQTAIREAANLMERLSAVPWDELTPQGVRDVRLSDEARRSLPGGELEIQLGSLPDQPGAKRIVVSLRWQDQTGQLAQPVRLVAWRYRGI